MLNQPKVTVILTSYNHAKYLREAIDSVLAQTYSDFELIIGDDASPDESWEIIKSYSDSRIRAFRHETRKGGFILNEALTEMKTGELIAIHHSDDIWEPDKLEKQVVFLEKNSEVGAVFTWAQIIDEDGAPFEDEAHFYYKIFEQPNRTRHEWLNYFFYKGNALCHPSLLIRKECYDECGLYRPGLMQIGDFDMWVRLAMKHEIHVLPEKLVRFRVRANESNSSGNRPDARIRSFFEHFQLLSSYKNISTFEELEKIFPAAKEYIRDDGVDIGYILGMISLESQHSSPTELFGLSLLFEAINDFDRAKKVFNLYRFNHANFAKLSAKHDIFSIEVIRHLDKLVVERDARLVERDVWLAERDVRLAERDVRLAEQEIQLMERNAELREITISKTWRVALLLRKGRGFLIPPNSLRAKIARKTVSFILFPLKIRSKIKINRELQLLRASSLFDANWYLSQNPDVAGREIDASKHYLFYGGFEGRDPSSFFSSQWYLDTYLDVQTMGSNPLVHYLVYGQAEGRFVSEGEKLPSSMSYEKKNWINKQVSFFRFVLDRISHKINLFGGIKPALGNIWFIIRRKGIQEYIKQLQSKYEESQEKLFIESDFDAEKLKIQTFDIVPYFLNPYFSIPDDAFSDKSKIAVHWHLLDDECFEKYIKYFDNIPVAFDLFISLHINHNQDIITQTLKSNLVLMNDIVIRKVSPCGESLAPFVIEFGAQLQGYDIVAHLCTEKYAEKEASAFDDALKKLFGSKSSIYQIIELLLDKGKIVYSVPDGEIVDSGEGWGNDRMLAENFSLKFLGEKTSKYPVIEFPRPSVFWLRSVALKEFYNIELTYEDFLAESLPFTQEGTTYVLEKLLMIASRKTTGKNYRLHLSENIIPSPYYEQQKNYSVSAKEVSTKVLSYYLPQFYAIPENDKWHGKGFTEWHKVRSATPLFYGHNQQSAPHEDLGYYSLETVDTLKKQTELMKSSGVYGQIFYHYWFGGKKILEKPAQMLLSDKSIDMPFSFCWANENWTQKWDGDEDEILLAQDYSEEDAREFITYLIPFFKDKRYIKIDGKPVVFIYRPSSIPDFSLYKKIWREECSENNLPAPFVVAVLTRGAESPYDFGMDAGTERVLHDWTDGKVKDIKELLHTYSPINRSVLNYNEVAEYYMAQDANKEFPYFRSIIPSWDNTPRYGSDAYIVHNSTPEKFQEWLDTLIIDAQERLPKNQQFVIVNAWNEWAESDALEPDLHFGYAYLNSVGRALSGIKFQEREYLYQEIPSNIEVSVFFSDDFVAQLKHNERERQKIFTCLANSTVFSRCNVSFGQTNILAWASDIRSMRSEKKKANYTLHIYDNCCFSSEAIENMLKMALYYDAGTITPTHLNDEKFSHRNLEGRWDTNQVSTYMLLRATEEKHSIKCCVDAGVFISPPQLTKNVPEEKISTIIRYSKGGSLKLLERALFSLLAQSGCVVQPLIAVQDLTKDVLLELRSMLDKMPWDDNSYPVIREYYSSEETPDIRALMLNDALKAIETRYATFLDYDDVVFFDAYAWLLERLHKTGKNASFGLIYKVAFNLAEQRIKTRNVILEYGKSYADFLQDNLSPIHGFMLDLRKTNLVQIEFHEDMKYMEDYFLTLQIFTEDDTDWTSLLEQKFIGDYYFYEDKTQTLGGLNYDERVRLLSNSDYLKCQFRIDKLRKSIMGK